MAKAYTPFLAFTEGSWGVLEGQFRLSTASNRDAVESFDGNGETWQGELLPYTLTVVSTRKIFHKGTWVEHSLTLEPEGDGTYIYVGDAEVRRTENYVGFVDGGLPQWIRGSLDQDLTNIFGELASEWGFALDAPVEILFVFDGAEQPGLHQTGGAMANQIALQVSGDALLEPDPTIVDFFRWFLTHESPHIFQGAAGMADTPPAHAWLHEGVANTMAHRIGSRLASDRDAFLKEVYGSAFAQCVEYLESGKPRAEALQSGQFGAYYACGDFVALITEAHLQHGDIFDFWKAYLNEASTDSGGVISSKDYFELAAKQGLTGGEADALHDFVEQPVTNPRQQLTDLLERAGLHTTFDADASLTSLTLPN